MKKAILAVFLLVALAVTSVPIFAESSEDSTYVNMVGRVDSYGGSPAHGWLGAHAKVGEWAKVHVFWMPSKIPGMVPGRNYTYSFYAAKLVNTSIVELNYTVDTTLYDFYISGLWDVYNVTWVYCDGNFTLTLEQLVNDETGVLFVTGNWTEFAVAITDIKLIEGAVQHYCIRPFEIPRGDVNCDRVVDIFDLIRVARGFGSTPGNPFMPNYDFDIDLNFDYNIDIYDLLTVAIDLGKEC